MILYHAADLIWATRIKGTADALGLACRPVRSTDMLRDRLADSDVRALIVDLEAPDTALALVRYLRQHAPDRPGPPPTVVAWGPHVATDALDAARAAGADEVLTRGAFSSRLLQILARLGAVGGTGE